MAYRELFVVEIKEALRLWLLGHGYRKVAMRASLDRKTVRRYVEAARALGLSRGDDGRAIDDALIGEVAAAVNPGAPTSTGAMRGVCRAHSERIEGWLDEGCHGPKVVRLLGRHTGVVVPLRTLQRFVAEELERDGRRNRTVWVADGPPGQELQVDFFEAGKVTFLGEEAPRKLHGLLCTAVHSRHQFVWPCLTQTREDVIEGLEAAWRFFGGVFHVLVCDNPRALVDVPHPVKPKINAAFLEYAQSRGFEVDTCRVRKPRDKARVERQVQFVRDDWFCGERFGSLEEARASATAWCLELAGERDHGTTHQQPRALFEKAEQALLLPAPSAPYDEPCWGTVTLHRDGAVVVAKALYSVPYTVPEGELRTRVDRTTVKLYRRGRLLKLHLRQPAGGHSIDEDDLPPGKVALVTRDAASLQRRAEAYGPHVGEYVRRLLGGPLPWTRMRQVYRLNGLAARHGGGAADEACARALELDVVDVMRIERMLERGLVQRGLLAPRPAPPPSPDNVIQLRFGRDPEQYRARRPPKEGGPDAPA